MKAVRLEVARKYLAGGAPDFEWIHHLDDIDEARLIDLFDYWCETGNFPDWASGPIWDLLRCDLDVYLVTGTN